MLNLVNPSHVKGKKTLHSNNAHGKVHSKSHNHGQINLAQGTMNNSTKQYRGRSQKTGPTPIDPNIMFTISDHRMEQMNQGMIKTVEKTTKTIKGSSSANQKRHEIQSFRQDEHLGTEVTRDSTLRKLSRDQIKTSSHNVNMGDNDYSEHLSEKVKRKKKDFL